MAVKVAAVYTGPIKRTRTARVILVIGPVKRTRVPRVAILVPTVAITGQLWPRR